MRRILIAVFTLVALAWLAYLAVYQVDDAYIVYRYAENLAHGKGFVYNVGERVEGVSCFLWTILLVPFAGLGIPLPRVAPVLTSLAGLLILFLLPRSSARMDGRATVTGRDWVPSVLLAAHPAFAYWSVGALETVPFAALLTLALHDHMRERAGLAGRRSALWVGLATVVRPEAPVFAALLLVDRITTRKERGPSDRLRDALKWCGLAGAFYLPFLIARRLYFGDWLPNTYYAKMGAGLIENLEEGSRYTLRFFTSLAPGFGSEAALAALAGAIVLASVLAFALPRPNLRPAALVICGVGFATLLEGGDWMVLHRFWVPALPPFMLLLAAAGGAAVAEAPRLRGIAIAVVALLVTSGVIAGVRSRDGANGLAVNAAGYRFAHHEVARFMKERAGPGDAAALMDIGIIGYESGLRIRDISGLTDRAIARAPGGFLRKLYPAGRILAEEPRFIVLVEGYSIDARIASHPDFQRDYNLVFERNHRFNWTPPESYTLRVYERTVQGP
jgi:hypothetical protein